MVTGISTLDAGWFKKVNKSVKKASKTKAPKVKLPTGKGFGNSVYKGSNQDSVVDTLN